jgi:hypothetical protein
MILTGRALGVRIVKQFSSRCEAGNLRIAVATWQFRQWICLQPGGRRQISFLHEAKENRISNVRSANLRPLNNGQSDDIEYFSHK